MGRGFDRLITDTARQGFYIVYLFRSDLSGVYLSLNQGVTSIRDVYGADAKKLLRSVLGGSLSWVSNQACYIVCG